MAKKPQGIKFDRLMKNVYHVDFIKKNYEYKEEINFDNLNLFFFKSHFIIFFSQFFL